jgi:hypothetical protein
MKEVGSRRHEVGGMKYEERRSRLEEWSIG